MMKIKKLETISDTIHPDYPRIHMLNGYKFPSDKSTVFKYMPLQRFLDCVDDNVLCFVSPDLWYDPFEQLYHGIDCSSRGYFPTEQIACLCISEKSSTNEDASWRVYSDNVKGVRLSIDQKALLSLLNEYANDEDYQVYIGRVQYKLEKKEIETLFQKTSNYYDHFFPHNMTRAHYLSVMLQKRSAFSYENEVRIFLVKETIKFNDGKVRITCDYKSKKLVSNVMLSPYPPVRKKGDPAYNVREKMNYMESQELKRVLKDKVGCRIQQCLLYSVKDRIERVE